MRHSKIKIHVPLEKTLNENTRLRRAALAAAVQKPPHWAVSGSAYWTARFLRSTRVHKLHRSTDPQNQVRLLWSPRSQLCNNATTHCAYLLLLQAAPDSTRFTQCRISLYTIFLSTLKLVQCQIWLLIPHTHTWVGIDLTVPLISLCSTCQREKV